MLFCCFGTPEHTISDVDYEDNNYDKRPGIPQKIREQAWDHHVRKHGKKCFCCIKPIEFKGETRGKSHHCGHILAYTSGGKDKVYNLRPLCPSCNLSMGPLHLYEYMIINQSKGLKYINKKDPEYRTYKMIYSHLDKSVDKHKFSKMSLNRKLSTVTYKY
jgi:5-methylcytosine-specific restriction endonuclease McrA